jgi:hypothetical protein
MKARYTFKSYNQAKQLVDSVEQYMNELKVEHYELNTKRVEIWYVDVITDNDDKGIIERINYLASQV